MTNDILLYGEIFVHCLIYCIRKSFLIYEFATAVAKSYMTNDLLINWEIFAHCLIY